MSKKVVTFGEVMMRFSPPGHAKFSQTTIVDLAYGGGEANVAISLAYFGLEALHVTRFPDNLLGKSATQFLRHHWLDTSRIIYGEGRMGKYFLEKGAVHRSSEVVYERDQSAFSSIAPGMVNWDEILKDAAWFHWTGISPAISQSAADTCQEAINAANKLGIPVSGDIHSRKSLWQYGKSQQQVIPEMVQGCDVVIASTYDMHEILGIGEIDSPFEESARQLTMDYPQVKKVVDKDRESVSASHNRIEGFMWSENTMYRSPSFDVTHIVDRVGTGDAYAAGLIYGMLSYESEQDAVNFAAAACALKHTVEGDANVVSSEDVKRIVKGNTSGKIIR